MKAEPQLNKGVLKEFILRMYDIDVEYFEFVPIGELSYSYIIKTQDKKKYFLKLYTPSRLTQSVILNLDFSLQVVEQLNERAHITRIPHSIKNSDCKNISQLEDFNVVLWSFIEGKMVTKDQSNSKYFAKQMGALLAEIHRATDTLELSKPVLEQFEVDFKQDLNKCMTLLLSSDKLENIYQEKLRIMITPVSKEIFKSMRHLENVAVKLKKQDVEKVICHKDPIRHNVLINDSEDIFLIDWDDPAFAPFEQDIWFFINDKHFKTFINSYKHLRDFPKINGDIVIYYFFKRTLVDLTDWLYRILFENMHEEQNISDLNELEEDVMSVITVMEKEENIFRKKIKKWVTEAK